MCRSEAYFPALAVIANLARGPSSPVHEAVIIDHKEKALKLMGAPSHPPSSGRGQGAAGWHVDRRAGRARYPAALRGRRLIGLVGGLVPETADLGAASPSVARRRRNARQTQP